MIWGGKLKRYATKVICREKKKKKSIKEQLLSVTGFGLSNAPRQRTIIFCV